jgi:hypothetical protein
MIEQRIAVRVLVIVVISPAFILLGEILVRFHRVMATLKVCAYALHCCDAEASQSYTGI